MLSTGVYVRSATLHEHECRFYYVKPKSEKWKNCDTEPLLTVFCPYPRLLECLKATHSPNVKTLSVQVWLGQCWNPRRPLSRPALGQVAVFSDEIGDSSVYSRFQAFRFKIVGTPQRHVTMAGNTVTRTLTKFLTPLWTPACNRLAGFKTTWV